MGSRLQNGNQAPADAASEAPERRGHRASCEPHTESYRLQTGSLVQVEMRGKLADTAAFQGDSSGARSVHSAVNGCCIPAQVNGCCIPAQVNGSCIPTQVNGGCIPAQVNGAASLHKSLGAASLHKSMVTSLHKSLGAASLHKSMVTSLRKSISNAHQGTTNQTCTRTQHGA